MLAKTTSIILLLILTSITAASTPSDTLINAARIRDHTVVLDTQGRLLPWTAYDNIIRWSVNFIIHCPTWPTKFGNDPWYLITSKFNSDGTFQQQNTKQNNQGSNAYWAMETAKKYYAYSGDQRIFTPVQKLLDRLLYYRTPKEWAWSQVPRTQDNTPDGEYIDDYAEPDKMAMVALACLDYYKWSGKKKYLTAAKAITATLSRHVRPGDADHSPLPFRVRLRTGEVLDEYSAHAVVFVKLFEQIMPFCTDLKQRYAAQRQAIWEWIVRYPLTNHRWSGYYEDVVSNPHNFNQQIPLETARHILQNLPAYTDYLDRVPLLLQWVEDRFGRTQYYGAISIREQDSCFLEMGSHTARFASIAAMWYGISGDTAYAEKARRSFALATYSAYNQYSRGDRAINYVGIGYAAPWFSDSYWDYIPHFFDGMAELPDMLPTNADHLFFSTSIIRNITYTPGAIKYRTFARQGEERCKLSFTPMVLTNGCPLPDECCHFGEFRGKENILIIKRKACTDIKIKRK